MPAASAAPAVSPAIDRNRLLSWFERSRARSRQLFDLITPDAYEARPISLRHPVVFYEGHIPAFYVNTIIRKALGRPGINAEFERLFARGIDPDSEAAAAKKTIASWPSRAAILDYGEQADRLIADAIDSGDALGGANPLLENAQAVFACIEHELMHQETLLYIFHQLRPEQKRPTDPEPAGPELSVSAPLRGGTRDGEPSPKSSRMQGDEGGQFGARRGCVHIPAGVATLGAACGQIPFGWDNEFEATRVDVPAFDIDVFNVTNRDYLEFIGAGGYDREELWTRDGWAWRQAHDVRHSLFWEKSDVRKSGLSPFDGTQGTPRPSREADSRTVGLASEGPWFWRGFFGLIPLPDDWPVYVTQAEATAFARWKGGRLPTEAEYHRAAFGTPDSDEHPYPWGSEPPDPARHGNFDFTNWDPVPVGSYPQGASAWGVHDLVGNGWEWTSTVFEPFDGFRPLPSYPEYSIDFFDLCHYVMKGASPATGRELVRRSFRNWFRAEYPYVYATFRVVSASR